MVLRRLQGSVLQPLISLLEPYKIKENMKLKK